MAKYRSPREAPDSCSRSLVGGASLPSVQESIAALSDAYKRQLDEILARVRDHQGMIEEQLKGVTLLTRDETAARLCMSASKLDSLVKRGTITVVYCDRRPRFRLTEVARFIDAHTRRSR